MAPEIVADDRERAVIEELARLGAPHVASRLELGDFRLPHGYLVERKTVADVEASVRDGRWSEQRARLRGVAGRRWLLLVEGRVDWADPSGTAAAALCKAATVRGVRILQTAGPAESARCLVALAASLERTGGRPDDEEGGGGPAPYAPMAPSKRGNVTAATAYRAQLRAVPGVSAGVAEAVAAAYPSMAALAAAGAAAAAAIAALQLPSGRRVGPAVAGRLVAQIAGEDEPARASKRARP